MPSDPWVLGISASHNGAVCLLRGSRVHCAIQEERLTRTKRERINLGHSSLAIHYCLQSAKLAPSDLSMVVGCIQGFLDPIAQDLRLNPILKPDANRIPIRLIAHHRAHAVSAFAASGFADAAVLVVDGAGSRASELEDDERASIVNAPPGASPRALSEHATLYDARGTIVRPIEKHVCRAGTWFERRESGMGSFASLGGIFTACADLIFDEAAEAGKVMGLAPFGIPEYPVSEFFNLQNGSFVFNDVVARRFTRRARWPENERAYANLAASAQRAVEIGVMHLVRRLRETSQSKNLCYAGGVALNSILNERIIRESGFENVFIIPAAEDSGTALGAAYYGLWELTNSNDRRPLVSDSSGAGYEQAAIERAIRDTPRIRAIDTNDAIGEATMRLAAGEIGGWFQGGAELGPRALGQRSIVCDPRRADGQAVLNARVKHRESFRPFAPAILAEHAHDWFDFEGTSPFMLRVCPVRPDKRDRIPAVLHTDGTGRLQTVTRDNGPFYDLLNRFYELTGVPILLNTSYNVMGEPIVEQPEDALWDLLCTQMDFAVLGQSIVVKAEGYTEALDLIPRVAANRESKNAFDVQTPWGSIRRIVSDGDSAIVDSIDGQSNGWTLFQRATVNRATFFVALCRLRRLGIIDFHA